MPVLLRIDYDAGLLRREARGSKDGPQARCLLALAAIYVGSSRMEAARIGGVTLQIIRDWVLRFNAQGPAGLLDRKAPGRAALLDDNQRTALTEAIDRGPDPAVHGVTRWRIMDLTDWVKTEFGITIYRSTMSRELRAMGYRRLSVRPRHHAQNKNALEAFKKGALQRKWQRSGRTSSPTQR